MGLWSGMAKKQQHFRSAWIKNKCYGALHLSPLSNFICIIFDGGGGGGEGEMEGGGEMIGLVLLKKRYFILKIQNVEKLILINFGLNVMQVMHN